MRRVLLAAALAWLYAGVALAADNGNLTVSCGAGEYDVQVDGAVRGKCGAPILLDAGRHKIRVSRRGNRGEMVYQQNITMEAGKNLALAAQFQLASELDDTIGSPRFAPQVTLTRMQAIDRKIRQIREQFRNDLKNEINKIVAEKNPRYLKLAVTKKDEFESEAEFKDRIAKAKADLDREQSAEFSAAQDRLEGEYVRKIMPLIDELKQLSGQEFTITAENLTVELGAFNAENNTYPVSIRAKKPLEIRLDEGRASNRPQGQPKMKYIMLASNASIPLPRTEAREFKQHFQDNKLRAEITGNFETTENFTIAEARIIDDATLKSYSLFTSTFVDLGNDTVYDSTTKLIWYRGGNLPNQMLWSSVKDAIANLNTTAFLGFRDWRLPSKDELSSLVRHGQQEGFGSNGKTLASYFNMQGFKDVQVGWYWSSDINNNQVWCINLENGEIRDTYSDSSNDFYAWPVRGGKVADDETDE